MSKNGLEMFISLFFFWYELNFKSCRIQVLADKNLTNKKVNTNMGGGGNKSKRSSNKCTIFLYIIVPEK